MVDSLPAAEAATLDWCLPGRVRTSEAEVAVDVRGSGPPVVLTHGTPASALLWRGVVDRLAERYTVHLWDLPGYGASSTPGTPSVALHARTLVELLDHWQLVDPVLVGHDIGAATVLRAHLVHGAPAGAIALLDAAVLSPWLTQVTAHMQRHRQFYRSMPTSLFTEIVALHVRRTTTRPLPDEVERAYLGPYDGPQGQEVWLDHVAGFSERDTSEVVERLACLRRPVRVIWGAEDAWLPSATAYRLAAAIPTAGEPVLIPNAGHFVTEDAPEATAEALTEFLTRDVGLE